MKTISSLLALLACAALGAMAALAADKAACGCVTGKDGKVCGIHKDCCCSGEKAKGEKKAEAAQPKKTETCAEACATKGCKTEADCAKACGEGGCPAK
jgi:hypothetical protein